MKKASFLRSERPDQLLTAWDKRIEQQSRLVEMIEANNVKQLRGMTRDEERRARNRQEQVRGPMQRLDRDDFIAETLPRLNWSKLRDQFLYVDETAGAKALLQFVEEHLTHPLGEEFLTGLSDLVNQTDDG